MKYNFFKGSPNDVLGCRCDVLDRTSTKLNKGYIIGYQDQKYIVRLETTGDVIRTKKIVM